MPDELYWRCTPVEAWALLTDMAERRKEEQKAAILTAGIVAAAVYNANPYRKKGAKKVQPHDFLRREPKILTPAEMAVRLRGWAASVNKRHRA